MVSNGRKGATLTEFMGDSFDLAQIFVRHHGAFLVSALAPCMVIWFLTSQTQAGERVPKEHGPDKDGNNR